MGGDDDSDDGGDDEDEDEKQLRRLLKRTAKLAGKKAQQVRNMLHHDLQNRCNDWLDFRSCGLDCCHAATLGTVVTLMSGGTASQPSHSIQDALIASPVTACLQGSSSYMYKDFFGPDQQAHAEDEDEDDAFGGSRGAGRDLGLHLGDEEDEEGGIDDLVGSEEGQEADAAQQGKGKGGRKAATTEELSAHEKRLLRMQVSRQL